MTSGPQHPVAQGPADLRPGPPRPAAALYCALGPTRHVQSWCPRRVWGPTATTAQPAALPSLSPPPARCPTPANQPVPLPQPAQDVRPAAGLRSSSLCLCPTLSLCLSPPPRTLKRAPEGAGSPRAAGRVPGSGKAGAQPGGPPAGPALRAPEARPLCGDSSPVSGGKAEPTGTSTWGRMHAQVPSDSSLTLSRGRKAQQQPRQAAGVWDAREETVKRNVVLADSGGGTRRHVWERFPNGRQKIAGRPLGYAFLGRLCLSAIFICFTTM